jgi:hypothetical protein
MSRSLANAKASRSGERAPPVSGNRPITSIRSQSAFQQQYAPPTNVRTQQMQPPPQMQQQQMQRQMQQQQMQRQQMQRQQMQQDIEQPFKKLSISDAIGLITLRLGRVEQWIIETDHENEEDDKSNPTSSHQVIDNSILTSIIHRLDSLEKNTSTSSSSSSIDVNMLKETQDAIQEIKDQLLKLEQSMSKQSTEFAKQNEQVFKFNRDLVETKDLLKTFMMKYDGFCNEVNQQFIDYETALADLESKLHIDESTAINDIPGMSINEPIENIQISLDLKNEIEKELENVLN